MTPPVLMAGVLESVDVLPEQFDDSWRRRLIGDAEASHDAASLTRH